MGGLRVGLLCSVLILCILYTACETRTYYSDDFENVDENFGRTSSTEKETYSDSSARRISLVGIFHLASELEPTKLEIVSVDDSLKELDSVTAKIEWRRQLYEFESGELYYPSLWAKLKFTVVFKDSLNATSDAKPMEFVEYVKVNKDSPLKITLEKALFVKRIEALVSKKGYTYAEAYDRAHLEASWLLEWNSENKFGVANASMPEEGLEILTYLYGRLFLMDSTFYKTVNVLADSVGTSASWMDFLPVVEIADDMVRYYRPDSEFQYSGAYSLMLNGSDFSRELLLNMFRFVEKAYGLPPCDSVGREEIVEEPSSAFDKESFVCEEIDEYRIWFLKSRDELE